MVYIGVDLGTSAVKLLLVDENGTVLRTQSRDYPLRFPRPGWSEQDPQDWWDAVVDGIRALTDGIDPSSVEGIGCDGQMHGLVALDAQDRVLRPAILWNDGRTDRETAFLNEKIGRQTLSAYTGNIAFAGFTAPKLLWMRAHEPELFAQIRRIMLPWGCIQYKLTGVHACDYSDASGMLLLDVRNKRWSPEMLDLCSLTQEQMPQLFESWQVTGTLTPQAAELLSLPQSVRVTAGAGDNAAAAVGTGTVGNGACTISIGTSGTVFISSDTFRVDPHNALHAFAHADGAYHLMGCMLSAASCNKWLCEDILHTRDYAAEQAPIDEEALGRNRVFFLPYLMGERSPINDTDARALCIGMSMDTTRADVVQSVLEGVAFAIRDSVEVASSLGIPMRSAKLCGGGARSALWQSIFANVLQMPLEIPAVQEGPGYGGAMLAMVGCGRFADVRTCAAALTSVGQTILPDPAIAARYEAQYQKYRSIYPAVRELYKTLK